MSRDVRPLLLVLVACGSATRTMVGSHTRSPDVDPGDPKCPPEVVARVQEVDLTSSDSSTLFSWISSHADVGCVVTSLVTIAGRLAPASDRQVIGDFCSAAATYARFLGTPERAAVEAAYRRLTYHESIYGAYFLGLRQNRLDLRDVLRGKIPVDWHFTDPGSNAQTWHYFLYLASLDEAGAYDALAGKIAASTNGNDVTNLLTSLNDLRTPEVRAILQHYAHDARRADGSDGPGPTIAQTVADLLAR